MKIKKYQSSAGIEIWVGQDDYSNDQLSIKTAHANDVWFHVSGMPGSHVLLRCGEKDIAAYCLAKYVKKPRGAKPGTVTIAREKKIKVRPELREEI